jgi:hypothetical protein
MVALLIDLTSTETSWTNKTLEAIAALFLSSSCLEIMTILDAVRRNMHAACANKYAIVFKALNHNEGVKHGNGILNIRCKLDNL